MVLGGWFGSVECIGVVRCIWLGVGCRGVGGSGCFQVYGSNQKSNRGL
jgi:hypothetical protein